MQNDPVAPGMSQTHNRMIETQRRTNMQMIMMSAEDKAQVFAILETHAEMQDQRSLQNEELMSKMNVEQADDHDAQLLVRDLQDQNDTFNGDCDNLRRIAKLFA
jgi:uncharacterized Rmd1/YagE family protein